VIGILLFRLRSGSRQTACHGGQIVGWKACLLA